MRKTRIAATAATAVAAMTLSAGAASASVGSASQTATGAVEAAANPYTPREVCGYDYYIQRSHAVSGARTYQLYNGSYNCVVTIKRSSVGTGTVTTAGLRVSGQSWSYDKGVYQYYAGPVKQYAPGECVRFFGYHNGDNYRSPWGNCG